MNLLHKFYFPYRLLTKLKDPKVKMSNTNLISEKIQVRISLLYNSWFFILDQLIRITVLILYIQNYFPTWIFLVVQGLLIYALKYRYDKYLNKLKIKYNDNINSAYSNFDPEIYIEENIPDGLIAYQFLVGFIFSFWFFYYIQGTLYWYNYILNFIFSIFGCAMFLMSLAFSIKFQESKGILTAKAFNMKVFKENEELKTVLNDVSKEYPNIFVSDKLLEPNYQLELDPVDFNDTRIAKLESELKSIQHRSEAWMLESVFLGGLAFSGFLTVASANFLGKEPEVFNSFLTHLQNYFICCRNNQMSTWLSDISNNFFRNDLYIVIMLLCLLSSVFFLLVLTLRLRLNTLYLNMDHLIRILVIFNAKEEELFNLKLVDDSNDFQIQRLEKISKKINIALFDAENLLKELKPTAMMMNVYRNLAVFLFYLVLIVSGFYFMPIIAFLILSLAIFTQLFRLFETYSKIQLINNLLKRH